MEKLYELHPPRLITVRNDVNGFLILFRSHGVSEIWQAQVPIDIVGIRIDIEVSPCLNKCLNILDLVFEIDGLIWVKVACSVQVHPYPWASLCLENGNYDSM